MVLVGAWSNASPPTLKTCDPANQKFVSDKDPSQEVAEGQEIIFSYDMTYKVGGWAGWHAGGVAAHGVGDPGGVGVL